MTVKLIAIYDKPDDVAAFEKHYQEVHTPLVQKVPGLQKLTVTHIKAHLVGENRPYMIAEMEFPDQATFDAAMASAENKAAGKDVMTFAAGRVSLMVA